MGRRESDKKEVPKLVEDLRKQASYLRRSYREHFRSTDNEWIIEEMMEHCEHARGAAHAAYKAGVVTKEEYQQLVSAPLEEWTKLVMEVRDYEGKHSSTD